MRPTMANSLLVFVSLALGALSYYLFDVSRLGWNLPAFAVLLTIGLFAVVAAHRRRIDWTRGWLLVPFLFFTFATVWYDSQMLFFWNFVAIFGLGGLLVLSLFGHSLHQFSFALYIQVLSVPFRMLSGFLRTLVEFSRLSSVLQGHPRARQVLQGVIIAIPLLVIFGWLFASADAVFADLVERLVLFLFTPEVIPFILTTGLVGSAVMGLYAATLKGYTLPVRSALAETKARAVTPTLVVLGLINTLFFGFLVIQYLYLVRGMEYVFTQGMNYAEYARGGFFQLIIVALISFVCIHNLSMKHLSDQGRGESVLGRRVFRIVASLLGVQTILVMASSLERLRLYQEAYGLTELRLYSTISIYYLLAFMALVLWYIWTRYQSHRVAFGALLGAIVFLAGVNFLNPDLYIAQSNIADYSRTGKIDTYHLMYLSSDAVPALIDLQAREKDPGMQSALTGMYDETTDYRYGSLPERHENCLATTLDWRERSLARDTNCALLNTWYKQWTAK
jgi:hypothetical protein